MKIQTHHFARKPGAPHAGENGMASVVFIALLAIMMILITAESRALWQLRREVKFLERQQIKRLNPPTTNTVAIATNPIQ